MAKNHFGKVLGGKIHWQESYASLVLGAIIVIILGLLVANFLTRQRRQIDGGEQISQPQAEEVQPGGEYKIVAGDSLSKISEKFYGSQEYWPTIARLNNIANPNFIFADLVIKLPTKSEIEAARAQTTVTSYQVQAGDTLFLIAEKVYGDGSKWTVLDRANGRKRLPNGNPLVLAGSTIVVPR